MVRTARRSIWIALVVVLACSVDAPLEHPPQPAAGRALPGPGPRARAAGFDPVSENAACERCHQEVAVEWRGSMHRTAWDDDVFLAAYAVEPLAFCKHCHAPELGAAIAAKDESRHLGVACVTCHVTGERILGTRELPAREGAHAVTRSAEIGGTAWCASCHQFEFPDPQEALMQSTVDEHMASSNRDRACQDCHMPAIGGGAPGRKSHAFRVFGAREMLRSSILASAVQGGERSVVVSLRAHEVGHAVPTGDMFRRLEVRARAGTGDDAQEAKPVVLSRSFIREETSEGSRRRQVGDSRVPADGTPREAELFFPRSIEGAEIEWQVVYRRMGPHEAALFGVDLTSEEIEIASGTLETSADLETVR